MYRKAVPQAIPQAETNTKQSIEMPYFGGYNMTIFISALNNSVKQRYVKMLLLDIYVSTPVSGRF